MEDNKELIPDAEKDTTTESQEVVTQATTDEIVVNNESVETAKSDNKAKGKKSKQPMSKKKKTIVITAVAAVSAIILGLFIWIMVILFGPGRTQDLSSIPLKVDMGDDYYIGTEGQIDYSKIFKDGSDFSLS